MDHSKKRIAWIDAAKGFCILAVVLYHFNLDIYQSMPTGDTFIANVWQTFISTLKPMRMPLFFLISGYLAHNAIFNKTWFATRTNKIASLLWVYILWFSVYWLFYYYLGDINPWHQPEGDIEFTWQNFISRLFIAKSGLWYLYALVIYFVLAKVLNRSLLFTMATGLTLAQMASLVDGAETWNYQNLASYFIYFAIGAHFKQLITNFFALFSRPIFLTSASLMVLSMGLGQLFYEYYVGIFRVITGLLTCAVSAQIFAWLCENFKMQWLRTIGQRTLPIYVLHTFFIQILAAILPVIDNPLFLTVEPIVITFVILFSSISLYHVILKLAGRWTFTMPHTFRRIAYRTALITPKG